MARRKGYTTYDPGARPMTQGEQGKIAEIMAQMYGYPEMSQDMGDAGFYGASPADIMAALQSRAGIDQSERDATMRMLLGQQEMRSKERMAQTAANANMYGSDQRLAGEQAQANALTMNTGAKNQNALQIAGVEARQRAEAAAKQSQARVQEALLRRQGQIDAANIQNQGRVRVQALKMLDPETAKMFSDEVLKATGNNPQAAMQLWTQIMGAAGYDPRTPFPGGR